MGPAPPELATRTRAHLDEGRGVRGIYYGAFPHVCKGDYRIDAPFIFEAPLQQAVVAPFGTFLKSVEVDPGDEVEGGKDILGLLDTTDLRLKVAALKAEQLGHLKQMSAAMRDGRTAEAQIAQALSEKSGAEIRLLEQHISQGTLMAPSPAGWFQRTSNGRSAHRSKPGRFCSKSPGSRSCGPNCMFPKNPSPP